MRKNIAVIGGGDSSEIVIAVQSAKQIADNFIDKEKYNAFVVSITKEEWVVLLGNEKIVIDKNDFSFQMDGTKISFDCAYITIHGTPGENGILQGYFELIGLPYTSCNVFSSALTFNKYACKLLVKDAGVNTAEAVLIKKGESINKDEVIEKLKLPFFLKPNGAGSSFGISKVKAYENISQALETAWKEDDEVIMESFVDGLEVSCGIIKLKEKEYILPITKIIPKTEFFDFNAKYDGDKSEEITPADLPEKVKQKLNQLCSRIYDVLNCNGIVRIDFIIQNDEPYFLEINTTPGMSAASIIPQQIRAAGLDIQQVFSEVIEDACIKLL